MKASVVKGRGKKSSCWISAMTRQVLGRRLAKSRCLQGICVCLARRETRPSARPRRPSAGARAGFAGRAEGRTEQQPCSLLRSGGTRAPSSSSEQLPAASSRQRRWPALAAAAAPQPARLPCARGPPSRLPGIRDDAEVPAPPLPSQQTPAPLQTPPAAPASPLRAARPAHRPLGQASPPRK